METPASRQIKTYRSQYDKSGIIMYMPSAQLNLPNYDKNVQIIYQVKIIHSL